MASWRLKVRLPSFKATVRTAGGNVLDQTIRRGQGEISNDPPVNSLSPMPNAQPESTNDTAIHEELGDEYNMSQSSCDMLPTDEPSLHDIKQKANVAAWAKVRQGMRRAAIECCAMAPKQACIVCVRDEATHRCLQCSAWAYYCAACFGETHSKNNLFHVGEVWQDGMFKPVIIPNKRIDVRLPHSHDCPTTAFRPLCCIDENGVEHSISFAYCRCEPLTVTMVRARLWPASPQYPQLAFCFSLLDWAEALLLECQVALKDLCKALYFKCPHLVNKRREIYSSLIDAFEEYRVMKVDIRNMSFVSSELDFGNICPACPQDSGKRFLSFDALFGLPRKKAAGKSFREPLHGQAFFGDQHNVDEFVAESEIRKKKGPKTKVCSDFLAGNELRSSRRYFALDETAVFGCACRHEFPYLFINLKHGERLSYAEWLLQEVVQRDHHGIQLCIMYDIACSLVKYLANSPGGRCLLDEVTFAIPSFHAYGHKADCQVLYSPQRCEGFGLSDGEVMERMWSYLRRFGRMTKEMRPSHRIDVLSHALLYCGYMAKHKLPTLLNQRLSKAKKLKLLADENSEELLSTTTVVVTNELVESWIEAEKSAIVKDGVQPTITSEWKLHYFHLLQCYYLTREQLISLPSRNPEMRDQVLRMDCQLADMELKCGIQKRWKNTDIDYIDTRKAFLKDKLEQSHSCLWSSVVRRHYLLKLKAKYADGQKIAKRLASSIAKEMKKTTQYLEQYNASCLQLDDSNIPVHISDVLNPSSDFWVKVAPSESSDSTTVPWNVRKDIIQATLMSKRCEEEIYMLEEEMKRVLVYWTERSEKLTKCLERYQQSDNVADLMYTRGVYCCLKRL